MRKASCAPIRLTWSLPPHSPAGRFAPKRSGSPLLLLSHFAAGLTSKLHRAHSGFRCLRGSFCLQLASTFNHRPELYIYLL